MTSLRPVLVISLCVVSAVAASAADQSLTRSVTNAFDTVVVETKNAAVAAAKAADKALASTNTSKKKRKHGDSDVASTDRSADKSAKAKKADGEKTATDGDDKAEKPANSSAEQKSKPTDEAKSPAPAAADDKVGDTQGKSNSDKGAGTDKPTAADAKAPPTPKEWPAGDVELAKARCTQLLKTVDAVTIPQPAFRDGECGAMAPVKVMSIGKSPQVTFDPAPLVTCDMVVALHKWLKEDVQPMARKHLGGDVIKIETMSDYSCRMAYGRVGNKLSEHGKANALDIRGFTTNTGKTAIVLDSWGQTRRDLERQIAAAKAAAEKADMIKAAAESAEVAKRDTTKKEPSTKTALETAAHNLATAPTPVPRSTIIDGLPKDTAAKQTFGYADARLGGPKQTSGDKDKTDRKDGKKTAGKDKDAKTGKGDDADGKEAALAPALPVPPATGDPAVTAFLHETHDAACQIFGTTLGPEANEAHRNHFHVDMAERKVKKICD